MLFIYFVQSVTFYVIMNNKIIMFLNASLQLTTIDKLLIINFLCVVSQGNLP